MEEISLNSKTRIFLIRKLLVICPVCKKRIYGKDIDILKIDISKINHWPLRYTHCHAYNNTPLHAITLFLDEDFSVRGNEISNFIKIDSQEMSY
ncbi:MAG: hypothetical protein ACFFBV_05000 [Promethearchaeota archaeon]